MVDVFQCRRIKRLTPRTENDRSDIELNEFFLLAVVDGIGQAGIHALVTLTAISAV